VDSAFHAALEAPLRSAGQVRLLERVAKEGPNTQWADDALWLLGEMARQAGDDARAVYYWQYLIALQPDVILEDETKMLPIYGTSGIPQVELYLRLTARQYVRAPAAGMRDGRHYVGVRPINATAMIVCEGLGRAYEALGKPSLALRAYRRALAQCPEEGSWRARFEGAVERLADGDRGTQDEEAPAAKADSGDAPPRTVIADALEGATGEGAGEAALP
jgi:tetratricopeptide (TPR) repeat protein